MKKTSEILGIPAVSADKGEKIGTVKEVIFSRKSKSVIGFFLERKNLQARKNVVLIQDVLSLGDDALIIREGAKVFSSSILVTLYGIKKNDELKGLRVLTKNGEDLGVVKDVLFDIKLGSIEGVLLSDGFLQDIVNGRNILPLFGKVEFGEDTILVEKEAVEEIFDKGKGIRNILDR